MNLSDQPTSRAWLNLTTVLAWSQSDKALAMLGLEPQRAQPARSVARSFLGGRDGDEPLSASDVAVLVADLSEAFPAAQQGEHAITSLAASLFDPSPDEIDIAEHWARFFQSLSRKAAPSVPEKFKPLLDVASKTMSFDRTEGIPSESDGGDDWDYQFAADNPGRDPATIVWIARILMDSKKFWRDAFTHLPNRDRRLEFLQWARAEATRRHLPYPHLMLPSDR